MLLCREEGWLDESPEIKLSAYSWIPELVRLKEQMSVGLKIQSQELGLILSDAVHSD